MTMIMIHDADDVILFLLMIINHTCLCDSMCDDTRDGLLDAT